MVFLILLGVCLSRGLTDVPEPRDESVVPVSNEELAEGIVGLWVSLEDLHLKLDAALLKLGLYVDEGGV